MSVNVFAMASKLHDVCGRVDYVTSPDRQENLMATFSTTEDPAFWQKLAHDSQAAYRQAGGQKKKSKCCEAREIIGALPDSAKGQDPEKEKERLAEVAAKLAKDFKRRTGVDCVVGIHYNAEKTNLHFHLIYSERSLLQEPEIQVADRNAWIDENGVRKRTKKEILDEDGQLRPGCKVLPKGEVISERYFGDKNPMFKDMGWLYGFKHDLADWINQELDPDEKREVFDKFGPYLAQKKLPKGLSDEKEAEIEDWNDTVKIFNGLVKDGIISPEYALEKKTQVALAPNQTVELKAIIAEIYCEELNLEPKDKEGYESMVPAAGVVPREATGPEEAVKRKLRDAHRRAALAWQEYRRSVPGSADRQVLLAKAKGVSAEIARLESQLGYDRPAITKDRQQAVWDVHAANKAAVVESGDLQEQRQAVQERRSAAWKDLQKKKSEFQLQDGYWQQNAKGRWVKVRPLVRSDEAFYLAQHNLDVAQAEYRQVRKDAQAFNRARQIEAEYRSFALKLASDPAVSDEDAAWARAKFQAAARRLRTPTPATCNEMQHQLADMKRRQRLRDIKAAERAEAVSEMSNQEGSSRGK